MNVWTDLAVTVSTGDLPAAQAAALLVAPGGVYVEDYSDLLEVAPQIAHVDLIDEELLCRRTDRAVIHLYLAPEQNPQEAVAALGELLHDAGVSYSFESAGVREEDWANAWKAYYHPVRLGRNIVVCPSWEEYQPREGQKLLRMDPGMAFGAGTHPTTRLCAERLEQIIRQGDRVLDMGTGSGILSVIALLLGASHAVGVDIDPVAARTARQNAADNGFGPDRFTAYCGDLTTDLRLAERLGEGYDVIVANIVADIVIALSPVFAEYLKPGGAVVASGIILPRRDDTVAALRAQGISVQAVEESEGWCAVYGVWGGANAGGKGR